MEVGYTQFFNNWGRQTSAMFAVEHKASKEVKYVQTNIKCPVYKLKKEVAKAFGIKAREYEFNYNDKDSTFVKPYFDWNCVWELIKDVDRRADSSSYVYIYLDQYEENDVRGRSITFSISEDPEYIESL